MLSIKDIKIATTNCGIRYKSRDDLLFISFPKNTAVAGVFTQSSTAAAPVTWCQNALKNGKAQALVVNSGNANAFTGKGAQKVTFNIAKKAAEILDCEVHDIFISSTGVIGEPLKDKLITSSLLRLSQEFSEDVQIWHRAAKAIMTTDTFSKSAHKTINISGQEIIINGFTKGSGMIAPNMATMLGYIMTNANIDAKILQKLLTEINEETFNSITVDSDTSTNDTVLLFATKGANHKEITDINDLNLKEFKAALKDLMEDLAKQIVVDGEGATKLIEIEVTGASHKKSAKNIAMAIANSPLVKTAIAGNDPNWGRIIMAIGKSEEKIDIDKISIKIGSFDIVNNSELVKNYDENPVFNYLKNKEVKIIIDVGLGNDIKNSAKVWTCDFTEGYIKINKDYRS